MQCNIQLVIAHNMNSFSPRWSNGHSKICCTEYNPDKYTGKSSEGMSKSSALCGSNQHRFHTKLYNSQIRMRACTLEDYRQLGKSRMYWIDWQPCTRVWLSGRTCTFRRITCMAVDEQHSFGTMIFMRVIAEMEASIHICT